MNGQLMTNSVWLDGTGKKVCQTKGIVDVVKGKIGGYTTGLFIRNETGSMTARITEATLNPNVAEVKGRGTWNGKEATLSATFVDNLDGELGASASVGESTDTLTYTIVGKDGTVLANGAMLLREANTGQFWILEYAS